MESVTQSCFFTKDTLSVGFVCRWLENNLPNLILPLHRFCVHTLTTVYRTIETEATTSRDQATHLYEANKENPSQIANLLHSLEHSNLNEPMSEKLMPELVTGNTLSCSDRSSDSIPLSLSWLLAAALPSVFTRLHERKIPIIQQQINDKTDMNDSPTVSLSSLAPIDSSASNERISILFLI